jgi:hypothetical protein
MLLPQYQKVQCQLPCVIGTILQRTPATDNRQMSFFQPSDLDLEIKEDFQRGANKDIGPKDIFEMASRYQPTMLSQIV